MADEMDVQRYREWYTSRASSGSDYFEGFQYHLSNQLHGIPLSGKHVLEVGCGDGAVSLYLAMCSDVATVVALDEAAGAGAPEGITTVLRDGIASLGVGNIAIREEDIMVSTLPDESFDLIIGNNALHHVVDSGHISSDPLVRKAYLDLFQRLRSLLVPGGLLSIREYSRLSIWRRSPIKLKWKHIEWEIHPTLGEWVSVIRGAGFNALSAHYTVPYRLRRLRPLFDNPVPQFFILPSFVITAKK